MIIKIRVTVYGFEQLQISGKKGDSGAEVVSLSFFWKEMIR